MHWFIPVALCIVFRYLYPLFANYIFFYLLIFFAYGIIWSILQLCKRLDKLIALQEKASLSPETTEQPPSQEVPPQDSPS